MTSTIKERPILFSGPMVRAILEGRKTVTRRVVKPQPILHTTHWWASHGEGPNWMAEGPSLATGGMRQTWAWRLCPYGQPGDRLWVREAWATDAQVDAVAPRDLSKGEPTLYPADGTVRQAGCAMIAPGKIRPSIHMPRWCSRILLEIVAVRVERLQDISDEQALAEGVEVWARDADPVLRQKYADDPKLAFVGLWTAVNGLGSYNANPWVWVIEYKRVMS